MRNEEEFKASEVRKVRNLARKSVFLEAEDPELGEESEGMWETAS